MARHSSTILATTSSLLVAIGCGSPAANLEAVAGDCPDAAPVALAELPPSFLLVNAYYLQELAADALRKGKPESAELEETLRKARALGARVVRTHGFNDDPSKTDSAIQRGPLIYDETSLKALDGVLARAEVHGLK